MNNIFRENAIKNLNALDETPQAFRVVSLGSWAGVLFFFVILIGFLIWGLWGHIVLTVEASGIIFSQNELDNAQKIYGDALRLHKEKVLNLTRLLSQKKSLFQKKYITIETLMKAKEDLAAAKNELINPVNDNRLDPFLDLDSALDVLVFIDQADGKKIKAGMDALILPSSLSAYDYGYIKGKVVHISEYPVSKEIAHFYLDNSRLTDQFFINSAPYLARVHLLVDQSTPSRLVWTTQKGAPFIINAGATAKVKLIHRIITPIELVRRR